MSSSPKSPPLIHRPLGDTGLAVSPLGLGTVKLGRDRGVKYPVTIPDDDSARALLAHARDLGINLLDTAPAYGNAEHRLGQLLDGARHDWVICTKVGEEFDGERSSYDFSATWCRQSIERSLTRLGTDYLDIVLIHSDGQDEAILAGETLDALKTLKLEGKVRAVGMSHKSANGARQALGEGVDVLMATLNREYQDETSVIAEAASQGCGILVKKALASGAATSADDDLRFVASQNGVHSIVVGTTNPAHLSDNVAAVQGVTS